MQKLLLLPLRLCVGWGLSPRVMSLIAAVMLVLLRLSIGWQFYAEGIDKYQSGTFDSAPFFANARGPFADDFRKIVWDHDGALRLDKEKTMVHWAMFRERIKLHYRLSEEDQKKAQVNYASAVTRFEEFTEDYEGDIREFNLAKDRLAKLDDDPSRDGVDTLYGQRESIRKDVKSLGEPILAQIDALWAIYEDEQNSILSQADREGIDRLKLGKPPIGRMDSVRINQIVPYFDIAIGLCLLLGFFTPVASLAAAGFLAMVFVSQYPPVTGPSSSIYQLIECMACLVLAGTAAGRFAGLDYFVHLWIRKVFCAPAEGANAKKGKK